MKNIGVFCSSLDCNKVFTDQANELGRIIGNKNYNLVFGGGKLGLMGVLAESAKKNGSKVISVIPKYLDKPDIIFDKSDTIYKTNNLFDRKKKLIDISDILIALPGGVGTLDEIFDVVALYALGETNKSIFLLNIENFWLPFNNMIEHLRENRMIRASDDDFIEARSLKNLSIVDSVHEIFISSDFI